MSVLRHLLTLDTLWPFSLVCGQARVLLVLLVIGFVLDQFCR